MTEHFDIGTGYRDPVDPCDDLPEERPRLAEVVSDETVYPGGGITLSGGTHFAFESRDGVCSLTRILSCEDGGGVENWAFDPEELNELLVAGAKSVRAARAWRRERDMEGEA